MNYILSLKRSFQTHNKKKKFQMSTSRKLVELKEKKHSQVTKKKSKNRIPLSISYNRTLPNISKIVNRNWQILQINTKFHRVFQSQLVRGVIPLSSFSKISPFQKSKMFPPFLDLSGKQTLVTNLHIISTLKESQFWKNVYNSGEIQT